MIDKTKVDRYKKLFRVIAVLSIVSILTLLFFYVWQNEYNSGVVFPFYYRGHLLIALIYVIFLFIFFYIYGGGKFGYLKCSNLILSQVLSVVCANFITYLEISLLSAKIVSPMPIVLLTAVEGCVIGIWSEMATFLFDRLFPPRRLLVLYDEYDPTVMEYKIGMRNDRYRIEGKISIHELPEEELIKEFEKYDGILIFDVHSMERNKILKICYGKSIRVYSTPKISDILIRGADTNHLFDAPLFMFRNSGFTLGQAVCKRIMDVVLSATMLLVLSPVMIGTAIAIKLYDGGPVFFTQKRCTINGRIFHIHKFRSMIVDAEKDGRVIPATEKDPRITPVGHFIRKTRIDELPQMIDILNGNMSIVGPRPERIEHVERYTEEIPEFAYRLKVKGGLTGMAQLYGKYNTTPYDKLKWDLMYIQSYSLILDIRLIFMTLKVVFMKESTEGFEDAEGGKIVPAGHLRGEEEEL